MEDDQLSIRIYVVKDKEAINKYLADNLDVAVRMPPSLDDLTQLLVLRVGGVARKITTYNNFGVTQEIP